MMVGIVYKSTAPISFHLKSGKDIELKAEGIINVVPEEDFKELMSQYGNFIDKRTLSDKNPLGCFVIGKNENYAEDMSNEIGEIKDGSAPIEIEAEEYEEPETIIIKEETKPAPIEIEVKVDGAKKAKKRKK